MLDRPTKAAVKPISESESLLDVFWLDRVRLSRGYYPEQLLPILANFEKMEAWASPRYPTVLKMAITCCKQTRPRWNCSLRISFSYEYHLLLPSVSNTDDDGDDYAHLYFNGCLSLAVYSLAPSSSDSPGDFGGWLAGCPP